MRFGPSQPFQPWESDYGKRFYGGGDAGAIGAASIYAASNIFSWTQSLLVPGIQAAANILLMNKQRSDYDAIVSQQRQLVGIAVTNYDTAINSLLNSQEFENAFPDVPQAAEYVPIDACCIQRATIECNISLTGRSDDYVRAVNRLHEQNDIIRAVVFDPRFLVNMDLQSMTIQDLLRGRLPVDDVMEIVTDNAEFAAMTGRIGNTRQMLLRDLGISRLRAQSLGRREFREMHSHISSAISPNSRQADIREMMQTPAQRIALALTQAQLIQQSLQNVYNRDAQKDPYRMAELQTKIQRTLLKLQFEANKAALVNQFVPNYAAMLQPQIQAVAGAIGDNIHAVNSTHYFGAPGGQMGGAGPVSGGAAGGSKSSLARPIYDENNYAK